MDPHICQVRVGGGQEPHDNIDYTLKGEGGKHQIDYVLHQCFCTIYFEVDRKNSFFDKLQVEYNTHYQHKIAWS